MALPLSAVARHGEGEWRAVVRTGSDPPSLLDPAVAATSRALFVHGGRRLSDGLLDDLLWRYELSCSCWMRLELPGGVPRARSGHSLTALRGNLYTLGGDMDMSSDDTDKSHKSRVGLHMSHTDSSIDGSTRNTSLDQSVSALSDVDTPSANLSGEARRIHPGRRRRSAVGALLPQPLLEAVRGGGGGGGYGTEFGDAQFWTLSSPLGATGWRRLTQVPGPLARSGHW